MIIKNTSRSVLFCSFSKLWIIVFLHLGPALVVAQINLVPNPGFEEITDCDLEWGDADKATSWKIYDDFSWPDTSPDLFHFCSTNPFYVPSGANICQTLLPNSGDGMVGMVNLISEERIYARLLDDIPTNVDIYLACSILPRYDCNNEYTINCFTNSQSLAFSDIQFQNKVVPLYSDTIIYEYQSWTKMETCYQASGEEKYILLGRFIEAAATKKDCLNPDEANFAYYHVDDVIVSPFDVVPDTLLLCENEFIEWDASFYDLEISWSDGYVGAIHSIDAPGIYTVLGDMGSCYLTDQVLVLGVEAKPEPEVLSICDELSIVLDSEVPAIWPDGSLSNGYSVNQPGNYIARLQSPCGDIEKEYIVEEEDCNIEYYVANVFSPNDDGNNDNLQFLFQSAFDFNGKLNIFDRWGNTVYSAENITSSNPAFWDGKFRGKKLNPAVFVWAFNYISSKDGKQRVIYGDILLMN